ncbi:hypothetical protein [Spirosoma migulaei]
MLATGEMVRLSLRYPKKAQPALLWKSPGGVTTEVQLPEEGNSITLLTNEAGRYVLYCSEKSGATKGEIEVRMVKSSKALPAGFSTDEFSNKIITLGHLAADNFSLIIGEGTGERSDINYTYKVYRTLVNLFTEANSVAAIDQNRFNGTTYRAEQHNLTLSEANLLYDKIRDEFIKAAKKQEGVEKLYGRENDIASREYRTTDGLPMKRTIELVAIKRPERADYVNGLFIYKGPYKVTLQLGELNGKASVIVLISNNAQLLGTVEEF